MGRGKMDDAAAARIRKARGEKDDFARRASMAARTNKENAEGQSKSNDHGSGNKDAGSTQGNGGDHKKN